jgi:hypothetical protein
MGTIKKKSKILFLLIFFALSNFSCVFPEKFDATITIDKDGRFSLSYEGILTFLLARMAIIENGKLSQQDEKEIKELEKSFLQDPNCKKSRYIGNGQFDIVYERKGLISEPIYFIDSDTKIVTIRLIKHNVVEIKGMKVSQNDLNELKQLKMSLDGHLRIKTNGTVLKENAKGKPLLGGLFGTYHWEIKSVEEPTPYMLIQLSTEKTKCRVNIVARRYSSSPWGSRGRSHATW